MISFQFNGMQRLSTRTPWPPGRPPPDCGQHRGAPLELFRQWRRRQEKQARRSGKCRLIHAAQPAPRVAAGPLASAHGEPGPGRSAGLSPAGAITRKVPYW